MILARFLSSKLTSNTNFNLVAKMSSDFANVRARYGDPSDPFDITDLASKDPIKQFDAWFQEARKNPSVKEANAMCLSTATLDGKPSSRMVLLKDFDNNGFSFFTNYDSRKGKELAQNPQASLCFYWDMMSRQIRIDGKVKKIEREKTVEYFNKRPFNSRVSAFISEQSKVIENRQVLIDAKDNAAKQFEKDQIVPTPENWGGYVLEPEEIEFWRGNDIRLHDRLRFRRPQPGEDITNNKSIVVGENGWIIERLSP